MNSSVVVTYETIFEILRREKLRAELQQLDKNFFKDVVKYLTEKQNILESQTKKVSVFSSSETQKTQKQIEGIKKMIKDLYERRERKIMEQAMFSSRMNNKTQFQEMLPEEKALYNSLVMGLNSSRKGILFNLLSLKEPEILAEIKPKELKTENKPHNKLIRFWHATPKFIGEDLKVYGPFEEEDVAALPLKVANILIKNSRAGAIHIK